MATNTSRKAFLGCVFLFFLPFAAVGLGMGIWMLSGVIDHLRMQSWKETPAQIVCAKLETSSSPGETDTYQTTVEYTYEYGGRQYTGARVRIFGGGDNFGSYQQDAYRVLSEHQKSGRPFRCYVNPSSPSQAVLFRDLRWDVIVAQAAGAGFFGLFGLAALAFVWAGWRKMRTEAALAALHPNEPWLWKPEWVTGRIRPSGRLRVWGTIAVALVWNSASWPLAYGLMQQMSEKLKGIGLLALVLLTLLAFGLFLAGWAVVVAFRWWKYGRSVFEMASVPGLIGGQLAGVIRTSCKVRPVDGFRLTLICATRPIGCEATNTSDRVVWRSEELIARDSLPHDPRRSAIPVLFAIPDDCRPTDIEPSEYRETIWRLEVSAKTRGRDLTLSFEVPVFRTPASEPV
jgi:hypothetical protein